LLDKGWFARMVLVFWLVCAVFVVCVVGVGMMELFFGVVFGNV